MGVRRMPLNGPYLHRHGVFSLWQLGTFVLTSLMARPRYVNTLVWCLQSCPLSIAIASSSISLVAPDQVITG